MKIGCGERGVSNAMLGVIGGVGVLAAMALLVYLIAAISDGSSAGGAPRGDVYVSMGDSLAAGNGASDASTTSFAALIASLEEATLFNVAEEGADTRRVIDEQLPQVLPILGSGRVRFITISAGGNDLVALIINEACVEIPPPAACPLADALAGVSSRLDEMLRLIRDANADVPIVLLAYPNLFSGTGHVWEKPAGRVFEQLTDAMQTVASKHENVVFAYPSFRGQGSRLTLTHVLDEPFDPHPNDAGHRIIADAMLRALEAAR